MQTAYRKRFNNNTRREHQPVVEDLREKLNRKKLGKDEEGIKIQAPPPDPVYNFLRDTHRDNTVASKDEPVTKGQNQQQKITSNDNTKRDVSRRVVRQKPNWRSQVDQYDRSKPSLNQPVKPQQAANIKIVIVNETGERKCTFDKSTIVEVPVPKVHYTIKCGKWPHRGAQRYFRNKRRNSRESNNNEKKEEDEKEKLSSAVIENANVDDKNVQINRKTPRESGTKFSVKQYMQKLVKENESKCIPRGCQTRVEIKAGKENTKNSGEDGN